ncbi:DUF1430 domain-containing protein [Exiguobacterium acetylicum]|uniref:DUF1430 domain-containing protein n=1 Tax=Exiguobacterium acetylicum TaxID=41170 RepID=UPI001CA6EEEA|nr:DUF1430 domain-containing protein [Exiguobacterium acetylicum]QZY86415.1 DUF1430 domain-containing protein [Exiguobacterium acetylicum]
MKRLKLMILTVMVFTSLFIIGESRMLTLEGFAEPFVSTTIYPNPKVSEQQMLADIERASTKHQVDVFTYEETPNRTLSSTKTIYGTAGVKAAFASRSIEEQIYQSVFLGDITFQFKSLSEHPAVSYTPNFYGIGSASAVKAFKMELIDTYAGNYPQPGYNESAERYRILGVFTLVAIITVLLTFYELAVVRKELLVRLSMGESLARWITRSILIDSGILLLSFIVSFLILRLFTPIDPYLMLFSGLMVGLIVVNGLVYLRLRRLTIKEAFSNGQRSNKLLVFTYGMKFVTAFLTILMLSSSITVIAEAVTIYKQRPFFEAKKNYSYTYIGHKVTSPRFSDEKSSDISERIQTELYTRFYDDFKVTLSTPVNSFTVDQPTVLMNRTAFNEVAGRFANSASVFAHELTFFAPEGISIPAKSTIDSGLRELGLGAYLADTYTVVRYQEDFETVAIDQNLTSGSTLIDDPLLIVVNEAKQPKAPKQLSNVLLADVMYDLDQEAFQDYVAEKQMTNELVLQTNAWEKYLGIWEAAKRLMNMNLIFVILILSLELLVIWTVLRLEYQVNAIELSVQKVMGYSIWKKNRRLIVSTMGITLVSTLAVALTAYILEFSSPGLLLAGGGLLLVAEGVLLIWLIRKIERANVQRILKGGNL